MNKELQVLIQTANNLGNINQLLSVGIFNGQYATQLSAAQKFIAQGHTDAIQKLKSHKDYDVYFYPNGDPKPMSQIPVSSIEKESNGKSVSA